MTKLRHQDRVNALEIEAEADSKAAADGPSVRTIMVAHSMGGFVAADAVISVVDEQTKAEAEQKEVKLPWIQGILAVDTPFLGIASPMLAYSAFSQFSKVSNAYRLMSMLPLSFLRGKATATTSSKPGPVVNKRTPWELGAIPAWRTVAAYTGTTGALAAAGVAAYMNREEIYQGYTWIQNHLQFVGVILKREQSRLKLARVTALEDFGFANLYTSLGQSSVIPVGSFVPERTFCALPPAQNSLSKAYRKEINLVAKDEIDAHTCMFQEERNPGYTRLLDDAQELIADWAPRPFHRYKTNDLEEKTKEAMDERINDAFKDLPAGEEGAEEPFKEGSLSDSAFIMPGDVDSDKTGGGERAESSEEAVDSGKNDAANQDDVGRSDPAEQAGTGEAADKDSKDDTPAQAGTVEGAVKDTKDDTPTKDEIKQTGKADEASNEKGTTLREKAASSLMMAANKLGSLSMPTIRKQPAVSKDSQVTQDASQGKEASVEKSTS